MPLSPEDVRALVAAFDASDWDEMAVTVHGTRVTLSRTGRPSESGTTTAPAAAVAPAPAPAPEPAPAPAAAPVASAPVGDPDAGGHRITSPSVGLFWRSPRPGAPPFVDVGDEVGPDDTVCIVEVMKLMNHIRAGVAGTVRAVHPANGEMVEHGQPLFTVEAAS